MSYYLKKTRIKGHVYLSIDESFYNPEKKGTSHRNFKTIGPLDSLIAGGMEDPIAYWQAEVDRLNSERKQKREPLITDVSAKRYLGYFPLKRVMDKLDVKKYVDCYRLAGDFTYDPYEILSSLVYARALKPCSKRKTYMDVLPYLYQPVSCSYDQLLDGVAFLGSHYEKLVQLFTAQTRKNFGLNTDTTYFDCTNFYFEIDREDDFRRKGPSKENRRDPIVGLGLLLDCDQVPIGMKMYPGNESEKPILREVIDTLKRENNITGRTIHVADKGLNCAQNIAKSKRDGDGYIFSKSVKMLPEKEKTWVLLQTGYKDVFDRNGTLLYRYKSCVDRFPYTFEHEGSIVTVELTEKRIATYNPDLAAKKRQEIMKMAQKASSFSLSEAKKSEFGEYGKYVSFTDEDGNKAHVAVNNGQIEKDLQLAGYNMLVTSEINMKDTDIYAIYHNLWRIEESFKIMKTELDARPVYLQKENSIKGHFLTCYIAVLLERLLQFKILNNQFCTNEIFEFMRNFQVAKINDGYMNLSNDSELMQELMKLWGLPLTNYYLPEKQIRSILSEKSCRQPRKATE